MNFRTLTSGFAVVLVAIMLVASMTGSAAAAELHSGAQSEVNTKADAAHNPYIEANVTKATHQMGWAIDEYEDDQGDMATLPAQLNTSWNNSYRFTYTDIETSAYGEFPVNSQTESDADAGAIRSSPWTTSTSGGSSHSISVSNVTTATGVEAVEISTSSMTDGSNVSKATMDAFKITSDVDKRYVQLVLDINTLDSGANVWVTFNDTDGDYVAAHIDPDDNDATGNILGNATGEGYVFQQQVGNMNVSGSGDGTMDTINVTAVTVHDADATIKIAGLNVEKTSPWTLGEERGDFDSDDDLENQEVTQINETGDYAIRSLETMGPAFDSATFHDLMVPMEFYSSMYDQPSDFERFNLSAENASNYPNFDTRVDDYRRLYLPDAYDLSYGGTELIDTVAVPDNRYQTVEYGTAVGETNFSDVSWTDTTSSYSSVGSRVSLTTSISAGEAVAVHYDYVVTSEEASNLMDTSGDTGGGGAPMEDTDEGGFFSDFWNRLMTGITSLLVAIGLKRRGGN